MSRKNRAGIVYSTNADFQYESDDDAAAEAVTLALDKQSLRVQIDRRQRGGKEVTLVAGFIGTDADLQTLGKLLKTKCGVGGTAKDGEILIQGDVRDKVLALLLKEGYVKAKRGN
ncbi:MAG: translation initiation factor [Hymenobacteraceae bacterium]|nr:translation initiation factor [Hymenobacteraceae bacterium]